MTKLEFRTKAKLMLLTSVIGESVLVGVRKRRAKVGSPSSLKENDQINAIIPNDARVDSTQLLPVGKYQPGIVLYFDGIDSLGACVSYKLYQFTTGANGQPDTCPWAYLEWLVTRVFAPLQVTLSTYSVQNGNEFEYQGTIFCVSKVYPDQQQALCKSFPVGITPVLPLDILKPLILARLCETSSDEE
jgi:hypothetical protein